MIDHWYSMSFHWNSSRRDHWISFDVESVSLSTPDPRVLRRPCPVRSQWTWIVSRAHHVLQQWEISRRSTSWSSRWRKDFHGHWNRWRCSTDCFAAELDHRSCCCSFGWISTRDYRLGQRWSWKNETVELGQTNDWYVVCKGIEGCNQKHPKTSPNHPHD